MVLTVSHLNKKIKGKTVLDDVCVEFESGKIYGIVGRNGSGKTMLFRALTGLIQPDSGEVLLNGAKLHKDMEVLPDCGILIENAGLYPELNGVENLKFLTKLNKNVSLDVIRETIQKVGLDPADKRPFSKYSLGMKQRLVFAQAIFEQPKVLFLDEPTNALDEEGVQMIRTLILEQKQKDHIILIASHNREDIDILVDETYRMSEGKLYPMEGSRSGKESV